MVKKRQMVRQSENRHKLLKARKENEKQETRSMNMKQNKERHTNVWYGDNTQYFAKCK